MSERHERLRKARENAGFKYGSDAATALGVNPSTYRAHENGQNDFGPDEAAIYAKKYGVDPLWLMGVAPNGEVAPPPPAQTPDSPNASLAGSVIGVGRLIPVYGQAVGGVDGEFEMNGNTLYEVMAPPVISDATKAYAVAVSGESMSPRYEDGEVCFVDPRRRVRRGDYVVAQIRKFRHDDDSAPLAFVKRFIRWNAEELVLEQFNPPKEIRFDAQDVVSVHYIALSGNA